MKILLLTIEPPLPFATAASKWFYVLLTELQKRGHEVTCFSVYTKQKDADEAKKLFPGIHLYPFPKDRSFKRRLKSLFKPYSYMFSKKFLEDFKKESEKNYDVVHVEQLWGGWAIPDSLAAKALINIHHLVTIDLEHIKRKTFAEHYEYFQTVRAEKALVKKFPFRRFFTERLLVKAHDFKKSSSGSSEVIPFSVDHTLYQPQTTEPAHPSIGMIASMGWYPGRSAALNLIREIAPIVRHSRPDCKVRIAGWNAVRELSAFMGIVEIEIMENIPLVEDFFKSLTVFVYMPSRGSGMKIKVMEAMLYGIPVVTSEEGLEGLPAIHREQAMIASTNEEAAVHALTLLGDADLRKKLSQNARTMIADHCRTETIMKKIEHLYQTINQK